MINTADRKQAVKLIEEAVSSGVALYKACEELGISKELITVGKTAII